MDTDSFTVVSVSDTGLAEDRLAAGWAQGRRASAAGSSVYTREGREGNGEGGGGLGSLGAADVWKGKF